mgnify:CR=1 FL=1
MKKNNSFASLKAAVEANNTLNQANEAKEMTNTTATTNQTIVNTTTGVKTMAKEILNTVRTSEGKKPMYLKQVSELKLTTIGELLSDDLTFGAYVAAKDMKKPQELKKTLDLVLAFYANQGTNVTECNQIVNSNEINELDNSSQGVEYTMDTPIVTDSNIVETFEEEVIETVEYT